MTAGELTPSALTERLDADDYLVDEGLAMALFLATTLGQPLLLEGEPGVGKTAAAQALAAVLGTELIRLQCYEGISAAEAMYEWDYPRQLLSIRLAESRGGSAAVGDLYTEEFLLDRPLLRAVRAGDQRPAVVLIDEVDRADDEFEAFLLEFLGEASVTIPELGTVRATHRPITVLTSNRSRELHDALKRRCFYHWIAYPPVDRAAAIVRRRVPGADEELVAAATAFVAEARGLDLDKAPGLAEAIDWVRALERLGVHRLARSEARVTIGALAKTPDDLDAVSGLLDDRLSGAGLG